MTRPVPHSQLVEFVARRMLSDMEDHGGVDEFCEKHGFQTLTDYADANGNYEDYYAMYDEWLIQTAKAIMERTTA